MDDRKEKQRRMSVPEFGGWNQKSTVPTDYSMVFSRARADRKQKKSNFKKTDLDNEQEFIAPGHHHPGRQHHHLDHQDDAILRKKKILTYINCCIRP